MTDCIFCKILSGELPASVVYQDRDCTALMDIQPVNAGYSDLPERSELDAVAQQIRKALQEAME